ncbi:MAG: hypothetical protein COW00_18800 [Bdellovibrio sp. CG12_big_fil_rev_8_21_14_0_65_39_13]|nr:MAG: hypothetical protein COW78_05870 [Bdellovibrio sp. CG22_combo_CG10-13_8_21_14_all_39_27]PIQ57749.1 MAG: hypothetical protein COW00_18800 [Bdellovibrio sp. CG12_big_fil_rev_8_21_14_0_65_39_13]PIR34979.1 MAG: hypothetical protein COV37_10895 [Bdellovibrio sp. CG11_big_fil_rev_8_21_14_0_20_39_38]PJB53022.1 MAG: hypothetical protein CO099_09460 [Bdellovibrio sp. CG_4_9_14_3_um_filter_39_7]
MRYGLLFLLLIWANIASSEELRAAPKTIRLAVITSDYNDTKYDLELEVDQKNEVQKIKTRHVGKNSVKEYGLDVLNKKIVLVKAIGMELITLRCVEFKPKSGCDLEIKYPSNLAVANFGEFQAKLVRMEKTWELQSNNNIKFTEMRLIARKLANLLVGIKRIEIY